MVAPAIPIEIVHMWKQPNGVLLGQHTGETKGDGIEVNIREAWKQINGLLGKKVYTTINADISNLDERYILTPEEAVLYMGPFPERQDMDHYYKNHWSPDFKPIFKKINPDPTREEAIELLLKNETKREEGFPRYWLAYSPWFASSSEQKPEVWIDHVNFLSWPGDGGIPMHIRGEKDGVPIIYYSYGTHSGILSHCSNNDLGLLNRIKEAGMTIHK
jgi:hypothetical protein